MTNNEREIIDKLSRIVELLQLLAHYQQRNEEFFGAIIQHLENLDTLREKRRIKAAQQQRFRAKKAGSGQTNVVSTNTAVDTTKEEERKDEREEEKHSPRTPYIEKKEKVEKKGEEKESTFARAREPESWDEEPLPPVVTDCTNPPSFGQVLRKAHRDYDFRDDKWLWHWYQVMCACEWHTGKGELIRNRYYELHKWIANKPAIDKLRDPGRIYDCRDPKPHQRIRSDNWRGMRKEDIEHVLS